MLVIPALYLKYGRGVVTSTSREETPTNALASPL
jgi:hypothetical protein